MFKIVKDNNKSLREKSSLISFPLSEEIIKLGHDMVDYLKMSQDEELSKKYKIRPGVGLAGPQIGKNIQIIAIYYDKIHEDGSKEIVQYALVNPKIISESVQMCYIGSGEGCLSVDEEHNGLVMRNNKILVKTFDILSNKDIVITARGYDAVVLQHEIDHLKGILFYDHIDSKNPFKKADSAIEL